MRYLEVLLFCVLFGMSLAKEYEEDRSDDAYWISWLKYYTTEPITIGSRIGGDEDSIPYDKIIAHTKEKLLQQLKAEEKQKSDQETSALLQNIFNTYKEEPPVEVEDATGLTQEPQNDDEATTFLVMSLFQDKETLLKKVPGYKKVPIDLEGNII
ncbi:unnamed protein product [Parnassius apollo]|uniref:(apollo) hypothetical protein n=1 Tax=Parnassius apollo TaxID=110799 RepID=A0A8S3XFG7_PARAO|nr:unnamed protein product [Parnassius apollo]